MELVCGSLMLNEVFSFKFYKNLKEFVINKKYSIKEINSAWYENYLLNELTIDELKIWIRSVFSHNKSNSDSYYCPIELEDIPRSKMLKWTSYNLYYKSLWQLNENQLNNAEKVLGNIEKK